ncbi:MAG: helix-turn-helix transcriptional regulator [Muribaculaceae bacterium]
MLVNKDTKLHDVVIGEPSVIAVLSRFGITLGIGDKSVMQICSERNVDMPFFAAILNSYISPEFVAGNVFSQHLDASIQYLDKTVDYYNRFLIPNVEQHFNLLIRRNTSINSNLELMRKFFYEVKDELLSHMAAKGSGTHKPCDSIEEKLNDLVSMFVIHLSGNYDINLCQAVLFAIIGLRKDISQYNRICKCLSTHIK